MNTTQLTSGIVVFLDRNLVLDPDVLKEVRKSLPTRTEEQLIKIYTLLKDTDEKQTAGLVKKLKEDPNFFKKLESIAAKEMYEKHMAEEVVDQKQAEEDLEKELELVN